MKVIVFAVILAVVNCLFNRCVSYTGSCSKLGSISAQFTSQYNINRKGIPTYQDTVSTQFGTNNCSSIMHQLLYQYMNVFLYNSNKLTCVQNEENPKIFDCQEYTEDVFYKVGDYNQYKEYVKLIENCNPEIAQKFISVKNTNCTNMADPFGYLRSSIGKTSPRTITYDDDNNPVLGNMSPDGKKCVWRYEVEGLWSTVMIFTLIGIIVVCLLLFIVLFVYAQKHRSMKRNALAKSLVTEKPAV